MKPKYNIQVREKESGKVIETVRRTLRAECIGNFNPIFCSYKGNNRVMVHSEEGDLSDARTLYIEIGVPQ